MVSEKLMRWFCPLFLFLLSLPQVTLLSLLLFYYYGLAVFIIIIIFILLLLAIFLITFLLLFSLLFFLFNNEFYKLVCFVVGFIMPRLDDTFINVLVKNVVIEPLNCELDVGFCKCLLMLLSTR